MLNHSNGSLPILFNLVFLKKKYDKNFLSINSFLAFFIYLLWRYYSLIYGLKSFLWDFRINIHWEFLENKIIILLSKCSCQPQIIVLLLVTNKYVLEGNYTHDMAFSLFSRMWVCKLTQTSTELRLDKVYLQ